MSVVQGNNWERIILHADMDAFFAAVEQLDNPEYRGKPLVIGSRSPRSVVSTASYEARPYGLKSAMPMVQALSLCPHVIVVPPRMQRYKEISDIIMGVFADYSPSVEPLSVDEAFIDMTGAQKIFGPPDKMAASLKADVLAATGGLTISVGVATSKYVAKVASDFQKPDGLTIVPPGQEKAFLWPLPLSKLWGVGPKSRVKVEALGLRTIGDVARFSCEELELRFGKLGERMWLLANALDDREVEPREEAKSIGREYTLSSDVRGLDAVWPHLRRSADHIARCLRKDKMLACGVRVKIKTADFKLATRQCATETPTDSAKELLATARSLLSKFNLDRPMRLVGMAAFNFVPLQQQQELFADTDQKKDRRLNTAMDRVLEKFGNGALKRGSELD